MLSLESLKRGDGIVVTVGTKGKQFARVVSVAADGKTARVYKWLRSSQRWTKRVTIHPSEFGGYATAAQFKVTKLNPEWKL